MVSSKGSKSLLSQRLWSPSTVAVVFLLFCLASSSALAACHAVSRSGAGSKTGADWNNSYAGIPGTLTRGDIYYFADGNYGAYTFSTAGSGTTTIEFRKAQSYDNCTSTGWNTSTMGSAQAIFTSTGTSFYVNAPYFVMNGNGTYAGAGCGGGAGSTVTSEPPTPSDCGFSLIGAGGNGQGTAGANNVIYLQGGGTVTFNYVELIGSGYNNGDLEIFGWASAPLTIAHMYAHNSGCVFVQDVGNNSTIDHSYFWGTEVQGSPGGCHGQAEFENGGPSNGVRSNNVYRDITGTAVWTFASGGTNNNWKFYNNVIFFSNPQLSFGGTSDAALDCINGNLCTNFVFVQNTIVNCLAHGVFGAECGIGFGDGASGGSVLIENNLYYSNPGAVSLTTNGTTVTEDYNSFLNSPNFGSGSHDVHVSSGASNPLVNWQGSDFSLASDNADWNNRLALSSPYTTDVMGTTFATDRGAYQYSSGSGAPAAPTGLAAAVSP